MEKFEKTRLCIIYLRIYVYQFKISTYYGVYIQFCVYVNQYEL